MQDNLKESQDIYLPTFGERWKYVQEKVGFTDVQVSDLVGISKQAVGQWKSKDILSKTVKKKVKIVCSEYGINLNWLANGIGEPMISKEYIIQNDNQIHDLVNDTEYAYAGSSGDYQTARVVEESWNYVKREVQKNNPMKIFRVVGDSMTPTLYDTDMVFAIPEPSIDDIRQTYIYVVHSNRHKNLLIKRVVNRGDGTLLLSSDNKQHKNFIINIEDIGGLWRVRAYLSWQMGAPVLNADRLLLLEDRLSKLEGKL